jgi:peptidoglycan hydrolase-like protein with peptidoglycan-binding domain
MAEAASGGRSRPARLRRVGLVAVVGCALAGAGAAAGAATALSAGRGTPGQGSGIRVGTAPVVRTDLTNTVQVSGSLGYAGSFTIVDELQGTAYTALPAPGRVVRRGQRLYEIDGSPVVLFYGRRPPWRTLALGVTDGPDVAQLDANLIALGYATPAALPVSDTFSAATAYAVQRWQAARGLPVTGIVPAGQVAYAPGPLRVDTVTPALGGPATPGATVLTATSPQPVVQAALPVGQEYLVAKGDQVSVVLPDGTTADGAVASRSQVATAGSGGPPGGPPPGQPASGPPAGGGPGGPGATVELTIRLVHPRVAGNLDQAPVTVNIVAARARNVLAVPVNALIALAGGGYAVAVPQGGGQHLVAVRTGLFSATLVQVSGTGLRPGMPVEVPAP